MSLPEVAAAVGSGSVVGFVLGLVGGGGSILATPLLLYVVGVANPHVAIGTSALAVSVSAYSNLVAHARRGHVWWRCAIIFAVAGAIGALTGSSLGLLIDGRRLLLLFGFVMAIIGVLMLRPMKAAGGEARPVDFRMCCVTAAIALLTGVAAGFFGIGGGFLIVPALVLATGMPMISAIGSSLVGGGTVGPTPGADPAAPRPGATPANPLAPNPDGHIIRWLDSDDHTGTSFTWDIFLLSKDVVDAEGQMYGSPDGLWGDPDGRLFIETDGAQPGGANDQLLVANTLTGEVRRLFTGVKSCEVTGIAVTPEPFTGASGPIPRDATIVITRKDGKRIGR